MSNHNPSPPILDSYDVDGDEKTFSPNVNSPMPPDKFLHVSNISSDNLPVRNSSDIKKDKDSLKCETGVNGSIVNKKYCNNDVKDDNSYEYANAILNPKINIEKENNRVLTASSLLNNGNITRKTPSPNSPFKKEISYDGKGDMVNKINSSEEEDSISCKTLNGDGDSNEENLISQRIDLNRRYMDDDRNSTSPSSMSSNCEHSQSSILNLINNHEAKHSGTLY